MIFIELVGGPRCGDKLTLSDSDYPETYTCSVVGYVDKGSGKTTEVERAERFRYRRAGFVAGLNPVRARYSFEGYPKRVQP